MQEEKLDTTQPFNADAYEMATPPKPGAILKGTIVETKQGIIRDFISDDKIGMFEKPDAKCMQIYVSIENGDSMRKIFNLPEVANKIHYRSNLGKFFQQYGSLPKEGLTVQIKFDAQQKPSLIL